MAKKKTLAGIFQQEKIVTVPEYVQLTGTPGRTVRDQCTRGILDAYQVGVGRRGLYWLIRMAK